MVVTELDKKWVKRIRTRAIRETTKERARCAQCGARAASLAPIDWSAQVALCAPQERDGSLEVAAFAPSEWLNSLLALTAGSGALALRCGMLPDSLQDEGLP